MAMTTRKWSEVRSAVPHHHMTTRLRWVPWPVMRLAIGLGLGGLFWVERPHHPDCTADTAVLEVN